MVTRPPRKREDIHIILPKNVYKPNKKIEITRSDATIDDISDYIISISHQKASTDNIGALSLMISNPEGKYTNLWAGGETIEYWIDYSDGSTKKFNGVIDAPLHNCSKNNGRAMSIEARQGKELLERKPIKIYENYEISVIIKDIISSFAPSLTTNNVVLTTITLTKFTLNHNSLFDAIRDLLKQAEQDMHIDSDNDIHTFDKNSVQNDTEGIAVKNNLISIDGCGLDTSEIKNSIYVYGNVDENMMSMSYVKDDASIALYGQRDLIIKDTSLATDSEREERGNAILTDLKISIQKGSVTCIGLETLNPGEQINIFNPKDNLSGYYRAIDVTDNLSKIGGWTTSVTIAKVKEGLDNLFKRQMIVETEMSDIDNPNFLKESKRFLFNNETNIDSLGNAEIVEGVLRTKSGSVSATVLSSVISIPAAYNKFEIRAKGENLVGNITFNVTLNDRDYIVASLNTLYTIDKYDAKLRIQFNINSADVELDSFVVLIGN